MPKDPTTNEDFRREVCDWLTANGINPLRTPMNPDATIADGQLTLRQKIQRNGRDVVVAGEVPTETVTVPMRVAPPADIADWLGPKCPTCGAVSDVDELIAWLRTQLDEDEQVARDATERIGEQVLDTWHRSAELNGDEPGRIRDQLGFTIVHYEDSTPDATQAEHIARWDPARVLAEVEAKRKILDLHWPDTTHYIKPMCHECSGCGCCSVDYPCDTVRLLALPYAGRSGWREEWALSNQG